VGVSSLTLLMNRKVFDGLTPKAQAILRQYSGSWFANVFITGYGKYVDDLWAKMKADPSRMITSPTKADQATMDAASKATIDAWLQKDPHNADLLKAVQAEIVKVRGGN